MMPETYRYFLSFSDNLGKAAIGRNDNQSRINYHQNLDENASEVLNYAGPNEDKKAFNERKGLPQIMNPQGRNCTSHEKVHHPLKLYTLKEYKELQKNFDPLKGIVRGCLGPSVKDEKWNERKRLVEKMMRFSHDVKVINTSKIAKYIEESVSQEKSSYKKDLNLSTRQKAWEFARNIEPPKIKKKKENFEAILEKDDLEDTLEYYEQRHRELGNKLRKKGKK